jgi:hypothetical protein
MPRRSKGRTYRIAKPSAYPRRGLALSRPLPQAALDLRADTNSFPKDARHFGINDAGSMSRLDDSDGQQESFPERTRRAFSQCRNLEARIRNPLSTCSNWKSSNGKYADSPMELQAQLGPTMLGERSPAAAIWPFAMSNFAGQSLTVNCA